MSIMSDPNALPIAGWYPDPENDKGDRWWNGATWSDHRRARNAPAGWAPSGAAASTRGPRSGNYSAALAAAGGSGGDLVTVTVYVVDLDDYIARSREIGAVWRRLVGTDYPAMAGIGVSRLWDVEALVEVQGVAVLE